MKKKILITGASRGIGAATAAILAKDGFDLFLVCKCQKEKLHKLARELEERYSIRCETVCCDVSDPNQVEIMIKQAGEIHVLINNAGISYVGLLTDMSLEQWHQVVDTNLGAAFYTSRLVIPQMLRRGEGKIINVSSVWGEQGASMEVAYSASKGGINSFTKALAKELGPSNIQVNAAAFGVIDTDMNEQLSVEEKEALRREIPADRLGSVQEAAQLIRQLVYAPAYFTGQVVTMDGGWQ